jgi:hypothetical protein
MIGMFEEWPEMVTDLRIPDLRKFAFWKGSIESP